MGRLLRFNGSGVLGGCRLAAVHPGAYGQSILPVLGRFSWALALLLCAGFVTGVLAQPTAPSERTVLLLSVEGAIGPGVAVYVEDGLSQAGKQNAALVVIRLDTPGGLDTATRRIVQAMLASPVPIAVWVAPRGARAASAGLFILSAAQLAAMAPGTATGAATPVRLGGGGGEQDDSLKKKVVNDAAAYVRGLGDYHGRNPEWLEKAVRDAVSASATEARQLGVIDLVTADLPTLLADSDGRRVRLPTGHVVLDTRGLTVRTFDPDWRHRLLALISDPTIAFLLLMVGAYGLILEFTLPGFGLPGVIGGIALILGLFAINLLPVDMVGLLLIGLGIVLLVAEAFIPSFGVIGFGGLAALVLGAVVAFDFEVPGFRLSPVVVVVSAALGSMLLVLTIRVIWRARRRPVAGDIIGAPVKVLSWSDGTGEVLVHGERWAAKASSALQPGQTARVLARHGLRLDVTPDPIQDEKNTP